MSKFNNSTPNPPGRFASGNDDFPRFFDDADDQVERGAKRPEKLAKIAGLQAVTGLFHRDPSQVMRLYYDAKMKKAVGGFCAQMASMQRPYRLVDEVELQKIAGTVLHGGVVAAALPREVPDLDLATARSWARAGEPVLILDGVGNPHNLGAIARSLAFFGLKYLVISDHPKQAGLSDASHRIAEGGLEHIEIYRAVGIAELCRELRPYFQVAGTVLDNRAVGLDELPRDARPLALVLGNEEVGLPVATLEACELRVVIRGTGRIQSLNVSATAAILIHQLAVRLRARQGPEPVRRFDADRNPPGRHKSRTFGG